MAFSPKAEKNNADFELKDLPLISAVMPSYNQGRYIREALDSILSQDYPNLEVLVRDGQSADETVQILKSYGDRIRWISEKDKGQSDALNQGFALAKGEIIAWLNADDLYDSGAFLSVGRHFAMHPECMWLFGRCIIVDENSKEIRRVMTAYKNFFLRRYSYDGLLAQNFLSQMAVFFRKKALDGVGNLDVSLPNSMDYDLWLRMGKRYPPDFIDRNLAKFRIQPESKTASKYRLSFGIDYACAKKHAGKKWWLIALHKIFYIAIILFYSMMEQWHSLKNRGIKAG